MIRCDCKSYPHDDWCSQHPFQRAIAERDAALARAEKSEKQHAADAAKDAYIIYRAQRQAERFAKHALRYRSLLKDSRTFLKQADFQRDIALAELKENKK